MRDTNPYALISPEEVAEQLAWRMKQLRLQRGWKQSTLAQRAGVSLASLRRFEQTGHVSLQALLRLAFSLGRLSDFEALLHPPPAKSIDDLAKQSTGQKRKRGTR